MNETKKLRVALFFGGVSSEHEVSCVSASTWLRALAQAPCADRYEVFPVGITKQGRWLACSPTPEAMADGSWEKGVDCTPCVLSPDRTDHGIWLLKDGKAELVHIDICAPVMHGKNGEDGTIQGLFELARIPYVGCGVLGSAVCMDKAVANTIMDAASVPHCKWASAIRAELEGDHKTLLDSIEQRLGYPIFVKPAIASAIMGGAAWAVYGLLSRVLTAEQVNEAGETIRVVSRMGNALGIFLAIAVAGVVYLVLVVAIRAISKDDLALMPKGDKLARLLRL